MALKIIIFVKTVFLDCSTWNFLLGTHGEVDVVVGTCVSDQTLQWGKVSQPRFDGSITATKLAFPSKHAVH